MRGFHALLLAVLAAAPPAEASAGAPAEASCELTQSCGAPNSTRGSSLVQSRRHLGRGAVEAEALEELEEPVWARPPGIVAPWEEDKLAGNASDAGNASNASNASNVSNVSAHASVSAAAIYSCPSTCPWCGPSADESQVVKTLNVKYGQALNWATGLQESLFLDIYEVPSADIKPVLVAVHGGGFSVTSSKDSGWAASVSALLARHGFLAVSIEYRRYGEHCQQVKCGKMSPNPKFEAPVHDVLAAVRYIRKNAAALRADPNKIALFGCSAGANTISHAMMNEWGQGSSGNAGYSPEVQAGVALSGTCRTDYLRKASGVAPYLAFHNEIDDLIPYSDAVATRTYLDSIGTPHELITLAGRDHCPNIFNGVGNRMQDFVGFLVEYLQLKGNTCPGCPAECSAPSCNKWGGSGKAWKKKKQLCVGYCDDYGGQLWCVNHGAGVDCTPCGASKNAQLTTPAPAIIAPRAFVPVDGGLNRVCRGASVDDNNPGHWTMHSLGSNPLDECKQLCASTSGCTGVEVHSDSGRCEVWTSPINASRALAGWACYRYQ